MFILCSYKLKPVKYITIGMFGDEDPPLSDVICADWLVTWLSRNDGIRKMNIGVYELGGFYAGTAYATRI